MDRKLRNHYFLTDFSLNFFFTIREFSHEVEILIVLYVSESFVVVKHYFGQESKVMTSLIDFVVRLDGIDLNETYHMLLSQHCSILSTK